MGGFRQDCDVRVRVDPGTNWHARSLPLDVGATVSAIEGVMSLELRRVRLVGDVPHGPRFTPGAALRLDGRG
jgi:hypothetical protein